MAQDTRKLVLTGLLIGALILAAHAAGIVICPLRHITGWPCPGCGTTRAVLLLLRGEFVAAMKMNPLSVSLAVILPLWMLLFRGRIWSRGAKAAFLVLAIIGVLANWGYVIRLHAL